MNQNRNAARAAVRNKYMFVANEDEAFSVFGRSEVQDITQIRQVTDTPFLVAFCIMCLIMFFLDICAFSYGNVLRLSEPMDYKGRLCGYDEEVKDRPLGYNPNPYSDMVVCVTTCPKAAGDRHFDLPDGPMGKPHRRSAYPTAKLLGQHCLPLDLHLAKRIISTKSVQSELYRAFGSIFTAPGVLFTTLLAPCVTSFIYIISLLKQPSLASSVAFACTAVTLGLVAMIMDLDHAVLKGVPLYHETHPLMLISYPYLRDGCIGGAILFLGYLIVNTRYMRRSAPVFRECMAAIINKNVLITVFASMAISVIRIGFIIHVCRQTAKLMSIVNPVQVWVQLFGEWHYVERSAWSPLFLWGSFFYAFGTFWILEFMSFCNKYITAQVLCHNYFALKARNSQDEELRHGKKQPIAYAIYSLIRYHLGSVALAALLAAPCRALRFFISFFVPDRPNLQNSLNQQHKIAYWLFWPLIQLDLRFLRFFKDSVWVMLPLTGTKYWQAARRVEGLLNRSRGKIPNLTKFTGRTEVFLNISVGLTAMFWTFFLYREPRHGRYHEVEHLDTGEAVSLGSLFATPEHSPLLVLPIVISFGVWVGNGMLHLNGMASQALTVCYCIDVEMAGGTETDALYVPRTLKECYKDLGGGESERELSEMIAQRQDEI